MSVMQVMCAAYVSKLLKRFAPTCQPGQSRVSHRSLAATTCPGMWVQVVVATNLAIFRKADGPFGRRSMYPLIGQQVIPPINSGTQK